MRQLFNNPIRRVLVTGGAGFIGGALIRRLIDDSTLQIFNLDKLGYASNLSSINNKLTSIKNIDDKYKFIKLDLCDKNHLNDVIKQIDPDLVFHLAAESHVDRSIDGPKVFLESNIIGTFNLLECIREHLERLDDERKGFFRFLHISTDEVYGSLGSGGYFSEDSPYSPRSPYSATKASSDHLVNAWHHTYNIPSIITNCSNNYGPWQFPEKLIPLAIYNALDSKNIPMYGDGANVREWLFVDDHVNALISAANRGKIGVSYCIGSSEELSNLDVLTLICEYSDEYNFSQFSYKRLIKSVEDRKGHDFRYSLNSNVIREELGWKPDYTFKEGLKLTIDWYIKNINWCEVVLNKKRK